VTEPILRVGVARPFFLSPRAPLIAEFIDLRYDLQESKIGLAVGKLRTNNSKAVSELAKEIVKQWKTAVEKAKMKATPPVTTNGSAGMFTCVPLIVQFFIHDHSPDKKPAKGSSTPVTPAGSSANVALRTAKSDGFKGKVGDNTRDKCVELLYDALACDADARAYFMCISLIV